MATSAAPPPRPRFSHATNQPPYAVQPSTSVGWLVGCVQTARARRRRCCSRHTRRALLRPYLNET